MQLSNKECYAVMIMLDVALHQANGPVSVVSISKRCHLSQSYVEQLFSRLLKNNLVKSVRGPGGGYLIHHDLNQLTVAQVVLAINETPLKMLQGNYHHDKIDLHHTLWSGLNQVIHDYLTTITYAQLICQHKEKKATG